MEKTQTEIKKKQAEDLEKLTNILDKQETEAQQTQAQPQVPIAPPPPAAIVAPAPTPTPTSQMKNEQCPSCNKEIAIPQDFEEGLCPYCKGYLDFKPKKPIELPKKISDQAMAKILQDQYTPSPQPLAPTPTPTPPIPPPLAPIAPAPPIPPQPQPQIQPQHPPQQNAPSERFIDKRAAAMDVMYWLRVIKIMGCVAIAGSFACLIMGMFYLDLIGMIVIFIVAIYVIFILKKITTHQNYLIQKYNLIKPTKQPRKSKYDPRLQPQQQPPIYPGGQY